MTPDFENEPLLRHAESNIVRAVCDEGKCIQCMRLKLVINESSIILIGVPHNTTLTVANLLFIVVTSVTSMGLIL